MAERVYTTGGGASIVAWIALILAAIALVIAWIAYNRTGTDLEQQIQTQVQKSIDAAENAAQEDN